MPGRPRAGGAGFSQGPAALRCAAQLDAAGRQRGRRERYPAAVRAAREPGDLHATPRVPTRLAGAPLHTTGRAQRRLCAALC